MKSFTLKAHILISVISVNCTTAPTSLDGNNMTYEHDAAQFDGAMADAEKRCAAAGRLVKHERTDCSERCISIFSCIDFANMP